MAVRRHTIAAGILVLAAVVLSRAAPADAAQPEAPCTMVSLQDGQLDWQSATSASRALEIPYDSSLLVAGADTAAPIEVTVEALGGSVTVFEGRPTSGDGVLIDVSDHARFGVGLYELRVRGACSASVWVDVVGRSPFATPAGVAAGAFALVGSGLVAWSVLRGNLWRGAFGGLVLGLGVAVLLQQFAVLPLTVVPLMVTAGGAAVLGGAGGAVGPQFRRSAPPMDGSPPGPEPAAPGGGTAPHQEVLLGAAAPRRLAVGREATLRFLAHREDVAPEVERQVAARSPGATPLLGLAACRWRVGTPVEVTVSAKGLDIAEPTAAFTWNGSSHIVEFDALAPEGSAPGTVVVKYDVTVEGIVVARLRHDLEVTPAGGGAGTTAAPGSLHEELLVSGVQPVRTAFASYASEDRQRVLDRVAAIRSFADVDVWLDTLSLHPGDRWRQTVADEIRDRDVFLLFWSTRAAASRWVEWEWRSALGAKDEDALQVQPLESATVAPPPPELAHLHFGDVLIELRSSGPPADDDGSGG